MKEDLIQYLWKTKNINLENLKTVDGLQVEIVNFGYHNHNAGPDFLNAEIELEGQRWFGHIEIHVKASDWDRHRHDSTLSYQNVILHVVVEADCEIYRLDGTRIPCIEIAQRISKNVLNNYYKIRQNDQWIPCIDHISSTPPVIIRQTLSRMTSRRFASSCAQLGKEFSMVNNDWISLCYQWLAWAMGLKVNSLAMKNVASRTPYQLVNAYANDEFGMESLLFGQSGLLPNTGDTYIKELNKQYDAIYSRNHISRGKSVEWKFSRLRPSSFPTIRIAQLVQVLLKNRDLEELIIHGGLPEYEEALEVCASAYWRNHYRFNHETPVKEKRLGAEARRRIIINAFLPIKFFFGQQNSQQQYKDEAISILEQLPPEQNRITRRWLELNLPNNKAADSQALIELKNNFCANHQCLSCPIGHHFLKTTS